MQHAVPLLVELTFAENRFPRLPHDVVAGTLLASDHEPQQFDRAAPPVERQDQRLDDTHGSANRARVSPRFEEMRAGNMPLSFGCGFVNRVGERDRVRHFRQRAGKVEIGRSIEHRVAAQDDERLDRACLHRRDERGQRARTGQRRILHFVVADRRSVVAKMSVQGADRGVDGRGLAIAGNDQPLAAIREEVLGERVEPARIDTSDTRSRWSRGSRCTQP